MNEKLLNEMTEILWKWQLEKWANEDYDTDK